jgi:uncharacterized protein
MPIKATYPGAYVQEVPGGVRSIAPVATSIAAFVGRAPFGPTDEPGTIFNFGDFQRLYGGLMADFPLSYAVQDFFENGGAQAVIARLFEPAGGDGDGDGVARLRFAGASPLILCARNPGAWGNHLVAAIDTAGISEATAQPFAAYDLTVDDLFNLTLNLLDARGQVIRSERFLNLTVKMEGVAVRYANRLDQVLDSESALARVEQLSAAVPGDGATAQGVGGDDGGYLSAAAYLGDRGARTGLYSLERVDLFTLLCIPPDRRILSGAPESEQDLDVAVRRAAVDYCAERRAFFIVDPPAGWSAKAAQGQWSDIGVDDLGLVTADGSVSEAARNAAVYFPRIWKRDLAANGQEALFAPCGTIAGIMASIDASRGVWKAPAGLEAELAGVTRLEIALTDGENGQLNPLGINCLRSFPTIAPVVWGARTLRGADGLADDYKYVPARRLALFIEESLIRGTQWAAFEPNGEPLWAALRLSIGNFLDGLKRQGAFYDYQLRCDASTTTAADVANGLVNILVQFAPLKPAEYIVVRIAQRAGGAPD